jgi:hypothetical protein
MLGFWVPGSKLLLQHYPSNVPTLYIQLVLFLR